MALFRRPEKIFSEEYINNVSSVHRDAARKLLDGYIKEHGKWGFYPDNFSTKQYKSHLDISESNEEIRFEIIMDALECQVNYSWTNAGDHNIKYLTKLIAALLKQNKELTEDQIERMLAVAGYIKCDFDTHGYPYATILKIIQKRLAEHRITPRMEQSLERMLKVLYTTYWYYPRDIFDKTTTPKKFDKIIEEKFSKRGTAGLRASVNKVIVQVEEILNRRTNAVAAVKEGELWTDDALDFLSKKNATEQESWNTIFKHCRAGDKSQPSKKWFDEAEILIRNIGREKFRKQCVKWMRLAVKGLNKDMETAANEVHKFAGNRNVLSALVWCMGLFGDDESLSAVGDLAAASFRKISGFGPASPKIGNACIYTLSSVPSMNAVALLGRLSVQVKFTSARKMIRKAYDRAARREGMSVEELEELSVPGFGIGEDGKLRARFENVTAELIQLPDGRSEIQWLGEDGKMWKSAPASVKQNYADELKKLRKTAKDIAVMLSAQRARIEKLFLQDRCWNYHTWRIRYLDHALLQHISRKLIWLFADGKKKEPGIWHNGEIVDIESRPLTWINDKTEVRLWHPIDFDPKIVLGWRQWLLKNRVTQPFKQAHREVYIITDAERETGTYSNRFAAHVIKQHQFTSLCRARNWNYNKMGSFDAENKPPVLDISNWNMTAEFWVDIIESHFGDPQYMTDATILNYITTDQVRFMTSSGEPVPLADVPSLVFSEVMRDVDLFVGVCSIGNDPTWGDQGAGRGDTFAYWSDFAFGALSESAKIRKELLSDLLPKLKIADRCGIAGKFLKVRGDLKTYKIHMGSGNILMEPNDRYLCIVPGRGKSEKDPASNIYLPFEGDRTLSVIISKAFLLADDKKIKDQSILGQIKG